MGAIQFADVDTEEMLENDNRVADEHDLKAFVEREAGPLPSQAAAG
jgi:hypothetical protein